MAEIIQLAEYKAQTLLRDGFAIWRQTFDGQFDADTCLQDLDAEILYRLAEPGDEHADTLYGLVIGFVGYGATRFNALDANVQSLVIDIHLFLADTIRFEMMVRLGWLRKFIGSQLPLFETVRHWEQTKATCLNHPPELQADHLAYPHYQGLIHRDQQVFIRRLLPAAMDAFRQTIGL